MINNLCANVIRIIDIIFLKKQKKKRLQKYAVSNKLVLIITI